MDPATVSRRLARLEYEAIRLPIALFEDLVITRYCDQDAIIRLGFERFLGSLDWYVGQLLDDEDIAQRGEALLRRTGCRATDDASATDGAPAADDASARPAAPASPTPPAPTAPPAAQAPPAPTAPPAAQAPPAPTAPPAAQASPAAPTPPAPPAAGTVDVTFTLPADVQADTVALCGDFNDWSAGAIMLEQASDGSWQVTVALEPGHSYRYRYLLNGERWENAWQADRYVPNAYGSSDSVIVVD